MAEKILIVVDMQNDFIDGALGTKEAVQIVERAAAKIQSFQGRIFATLDTHGQNYLQTAEGKKLPVPHCIKGTKGWQLNEKIEQALSQKLCQIIEKPTFGSVALVEQICKMLNHEASGRQGQTGKIENESEVKIKNKNEVGNEVEVEIEIEIEMIGLCTDICVVSNALLLKAHFPELPISVDASCCAGVTPQTHQAALETMKMCQIDVFTSDRI